MRVIRRNPYFTLLTVVLTIEEYIGEAEQLLFYRVRLWKKCIDKRMTKMQLKDAAHISYNAMAKMGKNKPVSLETLEKVCRVLECNVGDVIEFDINKEGKNIK